MVACDGLRVLEVSGGFTAAALCGQLLAGLGADVVKIEPLGGDLLRSGGDEVDGTSRLFHALNAGKESVTLDGSPAAQQRWADLAAWCDIVVWDGATPWPPGAGDAAAFAALWPRVVVTTVGMPGIPAAPDAELIVEAISSLMTCTGTDDRPPVASGLPYALHVGALFAFSGTLAALRERDRSGRGQTVHVDLADALVALLGNFMPSFFLTGKLPSRIGNRHTIAAPWNLYPTADGAAVICAGTGGSAWWDRILKAIGRADLVGDERYDNETKRVARVEEVDAIVSAWTRAQPTAAVVELMNAHDVPASSVASLEAVAADPHYTAKRCMFVDVPLPGGDSVTIPGLPMKIGAWTPRALPASVVGAGNGVVRPPHPAWAAPSAADDARPLAGVRVLEFGARTSVPFAARIMAELGADVIKIEPLKGEPLRGAGQRVAGSSYLFHINNAGKRSVAVNSADPEGRKLILDLVASADTWIENLAPGSLDAMQLGYADLSAANPRLVYCSVSGYGHVSAYGTMRALDTVVQASTGLMHVTGYPDDAPVKMGISAVDLAAAVALVGSVLGGLRVRDASGRGLHVDLAMCDVAAWMSQCFLPDLHAGRSPARSGNRSAANVPQDLYAAADGSVAIAVGTDDAWRKLCALLPAGALPHGAPAWDAAERIAARERIESVVAAWARTQPVDAIVSACRERRIPVAPLRSLADIFHDGGMRERKLIYEAPHPAAGTIWLLGNPIGLSRTPAAPAGYAPALGEHTAEVLAQTLALSNDAIERLRVNGTIRIGDRPVAGAT